MPTVLPGSTIDKLKVFNVAAALSELGDGLHACRRLGDIDETTYADLEQKRAKSVRGPYRAERSECAALPRGAKRARGPYRRAK